LGRGEGCGGGGGGGGVGEGERCGRGGGNLAWKEGKLVGKNVGTTNFFVEPCEFMCREEERRQRTYKELKGGGGVEAVWRLGEGGKQGGRGVPRLG